MAILFHSSSPCVHVANAVLCLSSSLIPTPWKPAATSNALAPEAKGADADVDLAEEQEELKQLKRLKISDNLTRKEEEQLEVMKKHKEQLEEEARKHEERQAHLRAAIQDCESELNQARELFCDVARRATGEILVRWSTCAHSFSLCMRAVD